MNEHKRLKFQIINEEGEVTTTHHFDYDKGYMYLLTLGDYVYTVDWDGKILETNKIK